MCSVEDRVPGLLEALGSVPAPQQAREQPKEDGFLYKTAPLKAGLGNGEALGNSVTPRLWLDWPAMDSKG